MNLKNKPIVIAVIVAFAIVIAGTLIGGLFGAAILGLLFTLPFAVGYLIIAWRFYEPIGPSEGAGVVFLGDPVDTRPSGAPYLPVGFYSLERYPILFNQAEFPAEPEDRYKGGMKERSELPDDMKPAIRQVFEKAITEEDARKVYGKDFQVLDLHKCTLPDENKDGEPVKHWNDLTLRELDEMEREEGHDGKPLHAVIDFQAVSTNDDGLHDRVTAELVFIVRWRVREDEGIKFIRTVGSVAEANRQLEDEMVSVTSRLLPHMSAGQALRNIGWINAHLFFAVIKRTITWGVEIQSAYMKQIELHHDLNDSIAAAAEARYKATAEKTLIIARGEAEAIAARDLEEKTLAGRAAGLKVVANDLNISGEEAQAAEVARAIADSDNTIILGVDSIKEAAGAASALLKKGGK